jgi:hypothetical protein
VGFEDAQKIARLNTAVLGAVPDEKHPGVVTFCQAQDFDTLAIAYQPSLIDDEDGTAQLSGIPGRDVLQEVGKGGRCWQSLLPKGGGGRSRRGRIKDPVAGSGQSLVELAHNRGFAGTGDPTQGKYLIAGG